MNLASLYKRSLIVLMIFAIATILSFGLVSIQSQKADAAESFVQQSITYNGAKYKIGAVINTNGKVLDGGATYTGPLNTMKASYTIPKSVPFKYGSKIVNVGVTGFDKKAFKKCKKVKTINSKAQIVYIWKNSLSSCKNLKTFKASSVFVTNKGFAGCKNLTTINFSYVSWIEKDAFIGCDKLKTVKCGTVDGDIAKRAFYKCKKLESVSIKKMNYEICDQAFYGCKNLKTFSCRFSSKLSDRLGNEVFSGCSKLKKAILSGNTLHRIGSKAFFKCTSLSNLNIKANTINSIGKSAFEGCTKLASFPSISTASEMTTISDRAFYGCRNLKAFTFNSPGDANIKIGSYAFMDCFKLSTLYFAGVRSDFVPQVRFGVGSFKNCTSLSNITNLNKLECAVQDDAFYNTPIFETMLGI